MSQGSAPATRKANGILGLSIASQFKGGDPYLILPGENTPEVLCPVLDCSVQETHEYTGKTPAKSCISKGQKSWDTITNICKYLKRVRKKKGTGSFHWCSVAELEAVATNRDSEVSSGYQRTALLLGG